MRSTILLLTTILTAAAADWPQYLGPNRNGVSPETGLARTWPAEGPKQLWMAEVGPGYGGAAIAQGLVLFLVRPNDEQEGLLCLDLADGSGRWNKSWEAKGKFRSHPGSRATPTIEADRVYTLGVCGDLHCRSLVDGAEIWRKNLVQKYACVVPAWGMSQSPVILRDLILFAPQAPEAGVVACRKATGQDVWRARLPNEAGYLSPLVTTIDGQEQVVMVTGMAKTIPPALAAKSHKFTPGQGTVVSGLDSATGRLLWSYDGWQCRYAMPPPTPVGDGRLFLTGGYKGGCVMIRPVRTGDSWSVREEWRGEQCQSSLHAPLLRQGFLYANSNDNEDGLVCLSVDGKVAWQTGKDDLALDMGCVLLADDLLLALGGRTGELHLVEASPTAFRLLAKAKVLDPPQVWGLMALSAGRLVIRDQKQAKCLDLRAP